MRLFYLFPLLFFACGGSTAPEATEPVEVEASPEAVVYCFRNELPYPDDPEVSDIEEMELTVEGEEVIGLLNILPAFKDQRVGEVEGTMKDGTIIATYTFVQEGKKDVAEITLLIDDYVVAIRPAAGNEGLGLPKSIERVDCE